MFGTKDKEPPKGPEAPPSASAAQNPEQKQPTSIAMSTAPKIGIALGSGLARGFAHIGVMRALKRHGIEPTIISGTSMGALIGGAYLANKLDDVEDWAYKLTKFKVLSYMDFRVKSSGGLIGGERLAKLMFSTFGDARVEDLPHPFIAVATDLVTGHEAWLRKGRIVDAMRASFSLPGIFPPVSMGGRWLIDGALVNPVPVSACTASGARMTIAVNVSGDIIGKAKRPGDKSPASVAGFDMMTFKGPDHVEEAKKSGLVNKLFRKEADDNPSIFGVMVSSLNIVQDRLARSRLAGDPPDVLIVPRIGHVGLMEFDRAEELIAEGEAAVERAMPDIKAAYTVLCTDYKEE